MPYMKGIHVSFDIVEKFIPRVPRQRCTDMCAEKCWMHWGTLAFRRKYHGRKEKV